MTEPTPKPKFEPAYRTEYFAVSTISGLDREEVQHEVNGVIAFIAEGDTEVMSSTTDIQERQVEDELGEAAGAWFFRASQENGDNVDCKECGDALNDDLPIANDKQGYAYHSGCLCALNGCACGGEEQHQ